MAKYQIFLSTDGKHTISVETEDVDSLDTVYENIKEYYGRMVEEYGTKASAKVNGETKFENKPCPICGGDMWDNRGKKTNPKAPDFKCKDTNCVGVIWPPKK